MFRNHPYRALRCSFRACWRLLIMICHVRSGNITWNEVHHGILFDRRLGVTGRAKYEILAAAVDFCTMVCNHWPWYFPRHFEWKAVESEAESFFFQCHVCFMERRIFYEMGSIQNVRDSTFNQTNIKHDISSYKRICAEFRVESPADFRFMHSAYHGLGNVFICVSRYGPTSTGMGYPGAHAKFDDEGGRVNERNLVAFIRNVRTQTIVLTTLCPTRQTGSHRRGCHG